MHLFMIFNCYSTEEQLKCIYTMPDKKKLKNMSLFI